MPVAEAGELRAGSTASPEVAPGMLGQASAFVYRVAVLHVLVVLAAAPGWALAPLLAPDGANVALLALVLLPLAPALSAGLYGWAHTRAEDDLQPGRHFVRGYRLNLVGVLRWWAPASVLLTVLAADLGLAPRVLSGPLLVGLTLATLAVVALALVASAHALVVTALIDLSLRDLAALLPQWLRRPGPSLGALGVVVSVVGLVLVVSPLALAFLAAPAVLALDRSGRPLVDATLRAHVG